MRLRSIIFYLWPLLFFAPSAIAQKRVVATVNPNADALNREADLYNPTPGTIAPAAGKLNVAREGHVAVRLSDGKVLIAAGYNNRYLKSVEIFDPASGSFTLLSDDQDMVTARSGAVATLLQGGSVLVAGGYNGNYLSSAEIFDPATETFHSTASTLNTPRQNATITQLADRKVLIVGGFNGSFLNSAEIFDPADSSFIYANGYMEEGREGQTATLLNDGTVLVTGGCNNSESGQVICDKYLDSAEIYDPSEDIFTTISPMNSPRMNHTATLLPDGRVLIAGGTDGTNALATAEVYDPTTGAFTLVGSMESARSGHTASALPDGKVLLAGGQSDTHLNSIEIFDPATGTFASPASSLSVPRAQHTATVLKDGRVLLAGGENENLLIFDVNFQSTTDNVSPNIVFSPDSKTGFAPYTGSGVVVAFSAETGNTIKRIETGGKPAFITPLPDGKTLAVVSVLDNRIFMIDVANLSVKSTYTFTGTFGFGSILTLSPDGTIGYISSTATGEVIKFDTSTGAELGRLINLLAPAQITITKDGNTLLIVDTSANEVILADSSTMTEKARVSPLDQENYATASFTIFNKAVLSPDETVAVIASQDSDFSSLTCVANGLFTFSTATGEILDVTAIGCSPGYTMLLPTGTFWVILGQGNLSMVPTWSPDLSIINNYTIGAPLGSANMVVSPDARFVYYALSNSDVVVQQDLGTRAIVASYLVGDNPSVAADQPSSMAVTPNGVTMAVLNFASNELDLLVDDTVLKQTKMVAQQNEFTSLSMVNLSDKPSTLKITYLTSGGPVYQSTDSSVTNPYTLELGPNAQASVDIATLLGLDPDTSNVGRFTVESYQPSVAGFSMTGKIHSSFLGSYVSNLYGFPLQADYREMLHDWIIPEIPQSTDATVEFSLVNPNYNASPYTVVHYAADGTELETKGSQSVGATIRETQRVSDLVSSPEASSVLITGGYDSTSTKNSADLYNVSSNSFSSTIGYMTVARQGHTATRLQSNNVVIVGGKNGTTILKSADLYYPASNYFRATPGSMNVERFRHTATALVNGKVLIAGGQNSRSINDTAELFDPTTGSFELTTGRMTSARDAHTATLLNDGRVLIVGGIDGISVSATAELYDPDTSLFTATGSLNTARAFHQAVKLPSGKVLVVGGYNGDYLSSAEIYDPATGTFTPTSSMNEARRDHTCTLLSNGTVLVTGGRNSTGVLDTAEIYDPETGGFLPTEGPMSATRYSHTATLLNNDVTGIDDKVLIAGGFGLSTDTTEDTTDTSDVEPQALKSADLYDPVTKQFVRTAGDMSDARQGQTATLLQSSDQGYLRVTSDIGLLFNEIYDEGGAAASINGINVDKYIGVKTIYSPLFVIAPEFDTLVNIINANQDSEALVTIRLHAPDGSDLAEPVSRLLPKNAQIKGNLWDLFGDDQGLVNKTGWIEISSSMDRIVGTVSFMNPEDTLRTSIELSRTPANRFVFPLVSEDSTFRTQISLLNSGTQNANVRLELWGPDGGSYPDAFIDIELGAGRQYARYLSDIFSDMQPHEAGNVRVISSNQALHGLAIISDRAQHFISAEPPVPYPGTDPQPSAIVQVQQSSQQSRAFSRQSSQDVRRGSVERSLREPRQ